MINFYKTFFNLINKILKFLNFKQKIFQNINFKIGLNNILLLKKDYADIDNIQKAECKIFSQNGEDGIIAYLLDRLDILKPNFIEIGVGSYIEANTRFLYDRYYPKGIIIDCEKNLKEKVHANINSWKGDLKILEKNIIPDNVNDIIKDNCDFEIDLFSIDIDGIDYWVIEKLNLEKCKIFIAEYNSTFGHKLKVSVPNIKNFDRTQYHYSNLCYGMSLRALVDLMDKKDFYFVGTNMVKNNAFFVSKNFNKEKFFSNLEIKDFSYYTDSNIRESRNIGGKLNYLTGSLKFNEIKECKVVDLSSTSHEEHKLKDLGYSCKGIEN